MAAVNEGSMPMNAGDGELSYTNNSAPQKIGISKSLHVLDEAIKDMINENGFPKCFKIADLGCSSGPNALWVVSHIIEKIEELRKEKNDSSNSPEYEVFLSDLHGNDFNTLFKLLPDFYNKLNMNNNDNNNNQSMKKCFVSGLPGSFYGRLFPSNSLNFVHSSYCLHWLSQAPQGLENNKDNICVSKTSPPEILEAYIKQHHKDFSTFLSSRGEEMVLGGRMVLTFVGGRIEDASSENDPSITTLILAKTLGDMVAEGVIKDADLHSFNLPAYPPTKQQVEEIVLSEGSFNLDTLEEFVLPWDIHVPSIGNDRDKYSWGKLVSNFVRAYTEPTLAAHFGSSIMDEVYERYENKMVELEFKEVPPLPNIVISLTKK